MLYEDKNTKNTLKKEELSSLLRYKRETTILFQLFAFIEKGDIVRSCKPYGIGEKKTI
jgi:hypothetical protein